MHLENMTHLGKIHFHYYLKSLFYLHAYRKIISDLIIIGNIIFSYCFFIIIIFV